MATKDGVYQTENGLWAYRFSILIDGKRMSPLYSVFENGVHSCAGLLPAQEWTLCVIFAVFTADMSRFDLVDKGKQSVVFFR